MSYFRSLEPWTRSASARRACAFVAAALALACSGTVTDPGGIGDVGGTGTMPSGGTSGTSGASATGGTSANGGSGAVGGSISLGGTVGVGGSGATDAGSGGDDDPAYCGDGLINRGGEKCDDGNSESGDGCTATCDQVEANYACPTPGMPCVYTVVCGDGRVAGSETCDDTTHTPRSGDGCDEHCQIEPGYVCPVAGAACRPVCGDGKLLGREQCDDANVDPGDGCDENCALEPGWVCPAGEDCRKTTCGDKTVEGSEQCDDGNTHPYDGCAPDCTKEPRCGSDTSPVGKCVSACGDGILLASGDEECDDGNATAGDGCSADCKIEPGYMCRTLVDDPPPSVELPIVIRDFKQGDDGHPDFATFCCGTPTGIVEALLGVDRKPVYAGTDADPVATTSGKTNFDQWYRDVDTVNMRFDQTITLARTTDGAYSMNSSTDAPWAMLTSPPGFFPIDDLGFGNQNLSHNYSFTSELRYWFEFKGNEILNFSGDDDVFVFVNGQLAVDLGGVHAREYGTVVLDAMGHGQSCTGRNCTPAGDIDFAMQVGNIYETVVFQAERNPSDSNYWLTLTNFLAGKSHCTPVCGDAIVTPDEACDLGTDKNTGESGGCNPDCTLAIYCGDGHVDPGEDCDDGANISQYGGCAPGCVAGPSCGDGEVQAPFEECDDGKNKGGYGECEHDCQYGPRCGDGHVDSDFEECDSGTENGKDGICRGDCTLVGVR
jgi:fibro-slime domain-containing protein